MEVRGRPEEERLGLGLCQFSLCRTNTMPRLVSTSWKQFEPPTGVYSTVVDVPEAIPSIMLSIASVSNDSTTV